MIIQTGMRTDIPAFYADWFANRLREGYVLVRNPYNPRAVTRYSLSPEVVDLITFCTKNPEPILPYLPLLKPYGQYWFVTITPYGREIEPHVPEKRAVLASFRTLSSAVGAERIAWRYDPVFLSETYTFKRHTAEFEEMAKALEGYTRICVISFIDLYAKVLRNFPEADQVPKEQRLALGKELIRIASKYGMTVRTCAEGDELAPYGADCSGCMSEAVFAAAVGTRLEVPRQRPHRNNCTCLLSGDIGQYDTCGHLCRYCYANARADAVRRNRLLHDPESPLLIGKLEPEDKVHEARQESWIPRQLQLF